MKTLPKVAIFLALPLIFFAATSLAVLLSASGLLIASSADEQIVFASAGPQLFSTPPPEGSTLGESTVSAEARPIILRKFLESYSSPLAPYSDLILAVSRQHKLDWRLLAAIAGAESTFCRTIPEGSYNCWGWGIHSRGTLGFSSFEVGIKTVSKGLQEKFLADGLTTIDEIMTRYAPVSLSKGGSWGRAVKYFMAQLEQAEYYR
ncbi:MAG: hypothetical protein BMS9Abin34_222 [Patescibacteria group bacterium]|nr:MAG: hypothetical protein BMS9Abin34_222 [Patescibacteria group bacterium]